jgi:hypothetical protein
MAMSTTLRIFWTVSWFFNFVECETINGVFTFQTTLVCADEFDPDGSLQLLQAGAKLF